MKGSTGTALLIFSVIGLIVSGLVLICFRSQARKVPNNYILLAVFTICETVLVSAICAKTSPEIVLMAMTMTLGLTFALTLYACKTKTDFTTKGTYLFACVIVLLIGSIFLAFSYSSVLHTILCIFGIMVYSCYLIYDT